MLRADELSVINCFRRYNMEFLLDLIVDGIESCIDETIDYIADKIRAAKYKKKQSENKKRT